MSDGFKCLENCSFKSGKNGKCSISCFELLKSENKRLKAENETLTKRVVQLNKDIEFCNGVSMEHVEDKKKIESLQEAYNLEVQKRIAAEQTMAKLNDALKPIRECHVCESMDARKCVENCMSAVADSLHVLGM